MVLLGIDRFDRVCGALTVVAIAIVAWGAHAYHVTIAWSTFVGPGILLAAFTLLRIRYARLGEQRLLALLRFAFWFIATGLLFEILIYLAARRPIATVDATLASWDRHLGLEVPTVLAFAGRHPTVRAFLAGAYYSLVPLTGLAVLVPPLVGQLDRTRRMLIAFLVSFIPLLGAMLVLQAVGPWTVYGFPADPAQAHLAAAFRVLKSDVPTVFSSSTLEPVVAFPSFHTIMSLLAASALHRIPRVGWLAIVWALLIVASTLTTGWHYVVDVLAGIASTGIALVVADRITKSTAIASTAR